MTPTELLSLMSRYCDNVRLANDYMQRLAGRPFFVTAACSGSIPRSGEIFAFGGGEYFVHGVGCRFESHEFRVDFDIEADGSFIGFEPWKLRFFVIDECQRAGKPLPSDEQFGELIEALIDEGRIERIAKVTPERFRISGRS